MVQHLECGRRCLTVVVTAEVPGATRVLAHERLRVFHLNEASSAFEARADLHRCGIVIIGSIDSGNMQNKPKGQSGNNREKGLISPISTGVNAVLLFVSQRERIDFVLDGLREDPILRKRDFLVVELPRRLCRKPNSPWFTWK